MWGCVEAQGNYGWELRYLLEYTRGDWVGFSVISGTVSALLGKGASWEECVVAVLRIVGDLYDEGVRAGELTSSDQEPFLPWPAGKQETLDRIEAEMRKLSALPDSGDICWFTK